MANELCYGVKSVVFSGTTYKGAKSFTSSASPITTVQDDTDAAAFAMESAFGAVAVEVTVTFDYADQVKSLQALIGTKAALVITLATGKTSGSDVVHTYANAKVKNVNPAVTGATVTWECTSSDGATDPLA